MEIKYLKGGVKVTNLNRNRFINAVVGKMMLEELKHYNLTEKESMELCEDLLTNTDVTDKRAYYFCMHNICHADGSVDMYKVGLVAKHLNIFSDDADFGQSIQVLEDYCRHLACLYIVRKLKYIPMSYSRGIKETRSKEVCRAAKSSLGLKHSTGYAIPLR